MRHQKKISPCNPSSPNYVLKEKASMKDVFVSSSFLHFEKFLEFVSLKAAICDANLFGYIFLCSSYYVQVQNASPSDYQ